MTSHKGAKKNQAEDGPTARQGEMPKPRMSYASVLASPIGNETFNPGHKTSTPGHKTSSPGHKTFSPGCLSEQKGQSNQASALQQEIQDHFNDPEVKNRQKAELCFYTVKEVLAHFVQDAFQRENQDQASSADITLILQFISSHSEFEGIWTTANKVRLDRNEFCHSNKPKLGRATLQRYKSDMVNLLTDKKLRAAEKVADHAKNFIEKVCELDYKISFNEEQKADLSRLEGRIEFLRSESEKLTKQKADKSVVDKEIKKMQCEIEDLKDRIVKAQLSTFYTELPWNLTVDVLKQAWPSIEDHLSEELAPKNLLLFFLTAEEEKSVKLFSRTKAAKYLLQQIKEKLPNGFLTLLNALHQTQQKVVIDQLELKIKKIQNPQPKTDNQATNDDKIESLTETNGPRQQEGKEQSAKEGTILKLTVSRQGRQQLMSELSVGNHLHGRGVFSFDMNSICVNFRPGSVIIYLQPLSKHAKETLSCFCKYGGMKKFVLDLLKEKDIFLSLPDGEVNIHVEVRYGKDSAFEGGQYGDLKQMVEKEPVSQDDNVEFTDNPQVIKQNLILQYGSMVEEIEPLQFHGTFVNGGILDKSSFEELEMIQTRRARAAQFLNQVLDKGDTALAALVDALRNSGNDDLASRLCTVQKISSEFNIEGQVDDSCIEVIQEDSEIHTELDILWSCDLTVAVKKNEDGQSQRKGDAGKLHQTVLDKCLPKLMTDLDVYTVCKQFIRKKELFDDVPVLDFLKQKTTSDKTMELIRQIQQGGQDTYERFKDCLVLSKQAYLKDMLEEEEAKVLKELMIHGVQETGTGDTDDELKRQLEASATSRIQVPEVQTIEHSGSLQRRALPPGKKYHVFFCYSSSDFQWVKETVEILEKDYGFVCCEYDRDNVPRISLMKFAEDSIRNAYKTVVVMTKEAFQSDFFWNENHMAITWEFHENRKCVVPVLLKDCEVPHHLKVLNYVDARDWMRRDIWLPKLLAELEK